MRSLSIIYFLCLLAAPAFAQDEQQQQQQQVAWFLDDFEGESIRASWKTIAGDWSVAAENLVSGGTTNPLAIANDCYVMRTKPYTIEARMKGGNGGVIFCLEDPARIANAHVVQFMGNDIVSGYLTYDGKMVDTRHVEYIVPSAHVRLRIDVDPLKRTYEVFIQDRSIALENLRFRSGYSGCIATKPGVQFDYFQILGVGQRDIPSAYLKSNDLQIDHLSYMALMDENMLLVNPVLGAVQRVNSIGGFILEIPVQGQKSEPRGVCVGPGKKQYIVDGGENTIRIYNRESVLENMVSGKLKDPRGIAVDDQENMYVVDAEGIKVFDKKGEQVESGAAGVFKDPKNIYLFRGMLYVTDAGQGKVFVLRAANLTTDRVIEEHLVHPWDVCTDPISGDIYVADPGASVVFQYDRKGEFIDRIDPVTVNGFISPRAVRVREGNIIVGDFERILIFKKEALSVRPSLQIGALDAPAVH